jgi:predicted nucleotidyltransferase
MNLEKIVRSVTRLTVRCLDPEAVILFGSVAQGRVRPESDVDLLVVGKFREPRGLRGLELKGLLEAFPLAIDLQLVTVDELAVELENPHSLARTIFQHGVCVYQRSRRVELAQLFGDAPDAANAWLGRGQDVWGLGGTRRCAVAKKETLDESSRACLHRLRSLSSP